MESHDAMLLQALISLLEYEDKPDEPKYKDIGPKLPQWR